MGLVSYNRVILFKHVYWINFYSQGLTLRLGSTITALSIMFDNACLPSGERGKKKKKQENLIFAERKISLKNLNLYWCQFGTCWKQGRLGGFTVTGEVTDRCFRISKIEGTSSPKKGKAIGLITFAVRTIGDQW